MNNEDATSANEPAQPREPQESGYGAPTPECEIPPTAATNPGSADPALRGQQTVAEALTSDPSLGLPEPNFLDNEEDGSDGEPGAGRLGGTDEQFRDEMDASDPAAARVDPADETPLEAPSTDAPLDEGNAGPTRQDRESFSSEPSGDAAGE
ncbi:hypothetical protein [Arthrobacter sp.]|jgi:hypothetical protein|uniref:hypothetical protein n=1 Tax=Arthrobacter sp. TaxID=1667 RepID=UPI00258E94A6|nr:hypothetical protein [Arthrobacter sp.]